MSNQRIADSLSILFSNNFVVFWHDVDEEFTAVVNSLSLDGVRLLRLDETPALRLKLNIESTPGQRWLIYSNKPEPEPSHDWLLDVRLRSKLFRADSTSILLDDLGLTTQSLRPHLKARAKFLRAKDRVERLGRMVLPGDTAEDLDRKMLAVLTRADQAELFVILQRLYAAMVTQDVADLAGEPKAWQDIVANDLEPAFWGLVQTQLGYTNEEPSLRDLLLRILVTDFSRSLADGPPKQLVHLVLPDRALAANAAVLVGRWRSDIAQFANYNALAQAVSAELGLNDLLAKLSAEQLSECMTFEEIELRPLVVDTDESTEQVPLVVGHVLDVGRLALCQ